MCSALEQLIQCYYSSLWGLLWKNFCQGGLLIYSKVWYLEYLKVEIQIGYVWVNIFCSCYILQFCERRNIFRPFKQKSAFSAWIPSSEMQGFILKKVKLFLIDNLCLLRDFTSDLILYNRIHLKNSGERSKFQPVFRLKPFKIRL